MFTSPGAIAFKTNFITIYWYGIIMAIAFGVGFLVVLKAAKKLYNDNKMVDIIYELAFYSIIGGILGARLYYIFLSWNFYSLNWQEIIQLQHGGLSIHGGLLGAIIAMIIYCRCKKVDFLQFADLFILALPLSQAIGRWGNFFNSEAFGLPTTLPWGVYIPITNRPNIYSNYSHFHPTFLYESILDVIIFLILWFVTRKFALKKRGIILFSYLILYSICRIFIESIRIDSVLNIFGIPIAIIVSFIIIIISIVALLYLHKTTKKNI